LEHFRLSPLIRDVDDYRPGQFDRRVKSTLTGEPEGLAKRLLGMPRGHYKSILGDFAVIELPNVRAINAIVPRFAVEAHATAYKQPLSTSHSVMRSRQAWLAQISVTITAQNGAGPSEGGGSSGFRCM
jgi:hypothetical protein